MDLYLYRGYEIEIFAFPDRIDYRVSDRGVAVLLTQGKTIVDVLRWIDRQEQISCQTKMPQGCDTKVSQSDENNCVNFATLPKKPKLSLI